MQNYIPMPPGTPLKQSRYRIKQFLSAGGFGATYTAEDTLFNNLVVVVKESFDQSPGAKEQFETEATILRSLTHDHLVRVTDAFIEPTGKMYLVMEYVEGEDLEDILGRSPVGLPEQQVLVWFDQVLDALAYCHGLRVVHRDLKPANIRLRPDGKTIKVLDFGIAKIGGQTVRTRDAARGVTDGYSPPEQYSRGTDTYSDVYSLGATLYTLLTGRVPPVSLDIQAAGAVLVSPRQLNPKVSAGTEQVILAAMQLIPAHRYQTAGEMRQALALVRHGKAPTIPVAITCPYCGTSARPGAKFCQGCGKSLVPVQPLVFPKSRHRATTVAELVHGCDSYWDEARDLLLRGEIERWLNQLGERDLARQAGALRARFPADPSAALEEFREVADPNRSRPILTLSPAQLDFARLRKGDTKVLPLTVANTGRGYLYGAISAQPAGWLAVRPPNIGCLAGQQQPIQVEVNTVGQGEAMMTGAAISILVAGRRHQAKSTYDTATERGAKWLRQMQPQTTQDVVFGVIGLKASGAGQGDADVQRLIELLKKQQHEDGGWGELATLGSSPYATGQVLYAFKLAGVPIREDAFRRGALWLLDHQSADGSWPEINSQQRRSDRMSNYATTMWAVIGLGEVFDIKTEAEFLSLIHPTTAVVSLGSLLAFFALPALVIAPLVWRRGRGRGWLARWRERGTKGRSQ